MPKQKKIICGVFDIDFQANGISVNLMIPNYNKDVFKALKPLEELRLKKVLLTVEEVG